MLGKFLPARRVSARRLASALAMGAALAGAGAIGTAATSTAALAQNSDAFAKVYQPLANIVNAQGADMAAARAQIPAVIAAISTPDDRNVAGNLVLKVGTALNDRALQRQGLELMLASGKVAPAQVGQFQFFVGNLAFDAKDYGAARTALLAAAAAGHKDEALNGLVAETYINEGQFAQGLEYLNRAISEKTAAGQQIPENWLMRGLKVAYENKLVAQANELAPLLPRSNPTTLNWTAALQVVAALNELDEQAQLDLYRLMDATNSFSTRNEYVQYIEAADPRIMSNEVSRVLQAAVASGKMTASDAYYKDVKLVVDQRAAADRADAPKLAAEARSAANGNAAVAAGDVYLSLGDFAQAEAMFQIALQKGGVDKERALTRLGIAQARQGKNAEAKANFAQVSGARAPVARMWQAYVESKA